MRSRVRHELKTWPEFFAAIRCGHKKFELRRDDRPEGFQVGDELLLKEWVRPGEHKFEALTFCGGPDGFYTGHEVLVRVDYVMPAAAVDNLMVQPNKSGLSLGFVIMSVSLICCYP